MIAVMGMKDEDSSTVEIIMFNADELSRSLDNLAVLMKALRKQGIKKAKAYGLSNLVQKAAKMAFRMNKEPGDNLSFVSGTMTLEFA